MKVNSLIARNYRNISDEKIVFSDGVNLLLGKNGAGKTNTLEAIYLFAICKSFRTSKESDFIMHSKEKSDILLEYKSDFDKKDSLLHKMKITFLKNDKKKLFYEDVEIGKISEFAGRFRAVFFTPDHLSLIKGSPDERRKFADMALSQIKPGYIRLLNEYYRILSQRNSILKSAKISGKKPDMDLLLVFSQNLAEKGAAITKQRAYFAEHLEKFASDYYNLISGEKEKLFIKYICSEKENPKDFEKVKNKYISLYSQNVETEIRYGSTKYGPHRDDMVFYISNTRQDEFSEKVDDFVENQEEFQKDILTDEENSEEIFPDYKENEKESSCENSPQAEFAARTFASQGQQRTAVLALKLAEGEIIKELCGEQPVYLFDDVLSELDDERKNKLLSLFGKKQVIITCCDENIFKNKQIGCKILVCDGKYSKI